MNEHTLDITMLEDELQLTQDNLEEAYSNLACFWHGQAPQGATIEQIILAQWGKERKKVMVANKVAKLLCVSALEPT